MKRKVYLVLSILLCFATVAALFAGCAVGHTHTYSNKWSTSETEHWHQATCEHTIESRDRQEHNFVNDKCFVCGYEKGSEPNPSPEPEPEPPTKYEFGDDVSVNNADFYKKYSAEEKSLYYTLWQETTRVSIEIDISQSELAKISEAYDDYTKGDATKADTYRKCNLTITVNGQSYYYEEVGIRMRGNTSRRFFADNDKLYAFVHFRFSLTETFDGDEYKDSWASELYHDWHKDTPEGKAARDERKDRSFATMEKFYYKWNKSYDQTYIREVYANRMFQAYGILAPHITLTQLSVKQGGGMESLGVGNLYELIDKQFIKRNFDSDHKGGDLYKCTYSSKGPADLTYIDDNICGIETVTQGYSYDLKTNDDPEDFNNHKYIKSFVEMLNAQTNDNQFQTQLEARLDMGYFARFEAVNYLLGNPDCIRNHSNNYYLYFTPEDADGNFKAYIIPYDYDRCLGVNGDWNPTGDSMVGSLPYTTATTIDENGRSCRNPLYTRTILDGGITKYRDMFTAALKEVLTGQWFTYDNFQKFFNAYKLNYNSLTRPSDLIISQCGNNIDANKLVFNENGSREPNGGNNLDVSYYMQLKRQTAQNSLDK